jgi:hypothetical protein
MITASYSGDNLPTKTNGALNQVITGSATLVVNGTTGGLTNQTSIAGKMVRLSLGEVLAAYPLQAPAVPGGTRLHYWTDAQDNGTRH